MARDLANAMLQSLMTEKETAQVDLAVVRAYESWRQGVAGARDGGRLLILPGVTYTIKDGAVVVCGEDVVSVTVPGGGSACFELKR